MGAAPALLSLAEEAINRVLRFDPEVRQRLGELHDRVIRLRLSGVASRDIYVLPSESGLRLRTEHDREPDVTISGEIPVFARLTLGRLTSRPVSAGEIQISGDIELGQRFQRILERIDIDWEEQAARVVGDVAAHQLGNAVRGLSRWSAQSLRTLGEDASEYLREETRLLAPRAQVESFLRAVDVLRDDVDRLDKRMARLAGAGR
ncbi:MAG: SCP2 sterol-binding domain-containing protein [Pseudomonadota bacterium]